MLLSEEALLALGNSAVSSIGAGTWSINTIVLWLLLFIPHWWVPKGRFFATTMIVSSISSWLYSLPIDDLFISLILFASACRVPLDHPLTELGVSTALVFVVGDWASSHVVHEYGYGLSQIGPIVAAALLAHAFDRQTSFRGTWCLIRIAKFVATDWIVSSLLDRYPHLLNHPAIVLPSLAMFAVVTASISEVSQTAWQAIESALHIIAIRIATSQQATGIVSHGLIWKVPIILLAAHLPSTASRLIASVFISSLVVQVSEMDPITTVGLCLVILRISG